MTRRSARRSRWSAATSSSSVSWSTSTRTDECEPGRGHAGRARGRRGRGPAPRRPHPQGQQRLTRRDRPRSGCREVETAAREGRLDGLGPRVEAIATQFDDMVAALEPAFGAADERRDDRRPHPRGRRQPGRPGAAGAVPRRARATTRSRPTAASTRSSSCTTAARAVDLVLLDLLMPGIDGFETLARIKGDAALAALPVIVISGLDELDRVVRCIEMGAADYLLRPFQPSAAAGADHGVPRDKRLRETIERQRTELARFVSPQIAALVSSPEGEQLLAGHRRQVTALFADLRGFTAFSETAEPEELLGVLRAYHGAMGAIVVKHGGTLEHFAGDGMLVFFNDPVPQDDHAARAVRDGDRDARPVCRPRRRLAQAGLPARPGDRHLDRLRDAGPNRVRGSLRLCRDRQRGDPRLAAEHRGRRPTRSCSASGPTPPSRAASRSRARASSSSRASAGRCRPTSRSAEHGRSRIGRIGR